MSFNSNLMGMLYESGLREIEKAYKASRSEFDADMKDAAARYEKLEAEGKSESYDEDEATGQRFYLADHLIDLNYQAEESLRLVRGAFAITLHHYWEKQVVRWQGSKRYVYEKAYEWLEERKFPIDKLGLERLRETANTIKHNSKRLYDLDPTMFDAADIERGKGDPDYDEALRLEDSHIDEFLATLRKSGPTGKSIFA